MRNILVPVEEHSLIYPVFEAALLMARLFDSQIRGCALGINLAHLPTDMAVGGAAVPDREQQHAVERASYQHFATFMLSKGVPEAGEGQAELSFGWHTHDLVDDHDLGRFARVFDITVLGRPGTGSGQPRASTAQAALFESGRPILLVPPTASPTLGETVVIAWNRSTETARTLALGMPLLMKASRIVVLELDGWGVDGPSGREVAQLLRWHGMASETRTLSGRAGSPGQALLSAAASLSCDLLIKGAYTQSRFRQMILGGATSHILVHTKVPVLMAH
jgi:nucleotide-binding universal stress UspA family protein